MIRLSEALVHLDVRNPRFFELLADLLVADALIERRGPRL